MPSNPFNEFFGTDPFAEMGSFREAFRQMVEAGWPMPRDLMPAAMASVVIPLDILDSGPDIVVLTNLPGVKPEDVNISMTGNLLTIRGGVHDSPENASANYIRKERRATSFYRTVTLPISVDVDNADARFEDGVLTLTLPKSEGVRPKTIKINQA